uniref:Uncharacterized protein n=1 Tax=Oryza meridionalis TaxID=40149 RepID=A0A0E0DV80_9ORYZ
MLACHVGKKTRGDRSDRTEEQSHKSECESDPTRVERETGRPPSPLPPPLASPLLFSPLVGSRYTGTQLSFPPPLPPATPGPLHRPPPRPPPPPTHPFASLPSPLDRTSTPLRPCPVFSPANPNPSSARQLLRGDIACVRTRSEEPRGMSLCIQ